jgi:hypothetical protein
LLNIGNISGFTKVKGLKKKKRKRKKVEAEVMRRLLIGCMEILFLILGAINF